MIQIRRGVFETNSSSVHSISIVAEEDFEKFVSGEMMWDSCSEKLVTKEEILKEIQEYNKDVTIEDLDDDYDDYKTYSGLGSDYEKFTQHYTTKNGDKIVAFGYYGYN